ncbi:YmdB family metallophosphoesterase, partial [Candidatus Dependentiae bacterium]|nr:YmdB family metallophosphoesterase [Candidatus Dependentiae bacterium]
MTKFIKLWFIGDVFGSAGRESVFKNYKNSVESQKIDITVLNGENSAGGFGITPKIADDFFKLGVDIITSGNHIWSKKEIYPYISANPKLIRPANFSEGVPGFGYSVIEKNNIMIALINLIGKVFILDSHCPFRKFDEIYLKIKSQVK